MYMYMYAQRVWLQVLLPCLAIKASWLGAYMWSYNVVPKNYMHVDAILS